MNIKYILNEIKKADDIMVEVYENLDNYEVRGNNKYLYIARECITEVDEILSNLEIDIRIKLEDKNE